LLLLLLLLGAALLLLFLLLLLLPVVVVVAVVCEWCGCKGARDKGKTSRAVGCFSELASKCTRRRRRRAMHTSNFAPLARPHLQALHERKT